MLLHQLGRLQWLAIRGVEPQSTMSGSVMVARTSAGHASNDSGSLRAASPCRKHRKSVETSYSVLITSRPA